MYVLGQTNSKKKSIKDIKVVSINDISRINNSVFYSLDVNLLINKKHAILNDIDRVKLYISPSNENAISSRITIGADLNRGQDRAAAAVRGEVTRAESLKNILEDLKVELINDIDITNVIDNSLIKKVKDNQLSDIEIFGAKNVYENSSNRKTLEKVPDDKKNKSNINYFSYSKNESIDSPKNKKRISEILGKYNELGIDVISENKVSSLKKFISNGKLENKNIFDKIEGRFTSIQTKPKNTFLKNFINIIKLDHKLEYSNFYQKTNSSQNNNALSLKSIPDIEENLRFKASINERLLNSLSEVTIFAILFSKGIKKEIQFNTLNIQNLIYEYNYPDLDFDFSIIKERKNNFVAKIFNNENTNQKYLITCIGQDKTKKIAELTVQRNSSKSFRFQKSEFKNYRFVSNCIYDGKVISNSKMSHYRAKDKDVLSKFIDFYCINTNEGFDITVNNVSGYKKVEILRRNISYRQKTFKKIAHALINDSNSVAISDNDVEDKNVYEYKIKLKDSNGKTITSRNVFIEKFCKKNNILKTSASLSVTNNPNSNVYDISVFLNRQITNADKLVNGLLGNYYSLFEDKLKTINENNQVIFDTTVTAINRKTGEQKELGTVEIDESGKGSLTSILPRSDYIFKISPRILLPNELIEVIANSTIKRGNTLSNLIDNFDPFLDQETGDLLYIFSDQSKYYGDGELFISKNRNVKQIKSKNNFLLKNERISNKKSKVLASFEIFDPLKEIDFFIFSYSINNGDVNFYDISICVSKDETYDGFKVLNFCYDLPDFVGVTALIAQPIKKTGEILNPFIIGSVTKE